METAALRAFADVEALAPEWWRLWERAREATPFQSPAWLIPWWRHFSPGDLLVLTVRLNGRLVGLAPSYIEHGPLGRRILPIGISLSDHLDVLLDPDCPGEAAAALARAAVNHSDQWDIWELEELAEGAAASLIPLPPGCEEVRFGASACPTLRLTGPDHSFPKAKRRQLSLARNRAARRGAIRAELASAETLCEALEDLFRLHEARWTSRAEPGLLAFEGVKAFHRDAASGLLDAGLLRLWRLRLGETVVAACTCFQHRGCLSFYLSGFDPAWGSESPGAILFAEAIRAGVAEGADTVDFLRGQEPYKYEWGAVDRRNTKRSIRRVDAHGAAA